MRVIPPTVRLLSLPNVPMSSEIIRAPDARQLFSIWGLRMADRHWQPEVRLGGLAPIITRHGVQLARLGLISRWAMTDPANAGIASVPMGEASGRSACRGPFEKGRWCVIPALAFFLPYFADETKAPQPWKIARRDLQGFAIAGVYDRYRAPGDGREVLTFAMFTAECRDHPVLGRFGRSRDAKGGGVSRQAPVLLDSARYEAWLETSIDAALDFAEHDLRRELVAEAPVQPRLPRRRSEESPASHRELVRLAEFGEDMAV